MTTHHTPHRASLRLALLLTLATLLLAALPLPPQTFASPRLNSKFKIQNSKLVEESLTTDYFTIFYPPGEKKTADWYAGFVDEVDRAVSELLGAEPIQGLTLHIYATEPDYWQANPMAELHPGILAHAIPEQKEIGVAVERLRQAPPAVARESFRHEITHIVAGALTNQRLPVGFHEGLGQYNELSSTRAQEVVAGIQEALSANRSLLSWSDLNDTARFRQHIEVAYPQSYTVMAFLAERYGMEPFAKFLNGLRDDLDYRHSILLAYGKPMETLEKEWRDFLPSFLKDGWKHNVLSAHDLDYGLSLMGAGRFAEAEEHFTQAERLYTGLSRPDRAAQAAQYLARATQAKEADAAATQARKDLEAHDYSKAHSGSIAASQVFATLNLPDYKQHADDISQLAQKGIEATTNIEKARAGMRSFNLDEAKAAATQAGQAFAALGDAHKVDEANAILSEVAGWQRNIGLAVSGAGALVLGGVMIGGGAALARKRRRSRGTNLAPTPLLREENQSWL